MEKEATQKNREIFDKYLMNQVERDRIRQEIRNELLAKNSIKIDSLVGDEGQKLPNTQKGLHDPSPYGIFTLLLSLDPLTVFCLCILGSLILLMLIRIPFQVQTANANIQTEAQAILNQISTTKYHNSQAANTPRNVLNNSNSPPVMELQRTELDPGNGQIIAPNRFFINHTNSPGGLYVSEEMGSAAVSANENFGEEWGQLGADGATQRTTSALNFGNMNKNNNPISCQLIGTKINEVAEITGLSKIVLAGDIPYGHETEYKIHEKCVFVSNAASQVTNTVSSIYSSTPSAAEIMDAMKQGYNILIPF